MKTTTGLIILVAAALIVTTNLATRGKTLDSVEMTKVKAACVECHGKPPVYTAAIAMHNRHEALSCSYCHGYIAGLKWPDGLRTGIKWASMFTMVLVLAGIVANLFATNRKVEGG